MTRFRVFLLCAIVTVGLMAIVPPWSIREWRGESFDPPSASDYSFIGNPPSYRESSVRRHSFGDRVARLDFARLIVQYIALASLVGAVSLVHVCRRYNLRDNAQPTLGTSPHASQCGNSLIPDALEVSSLIIRPYKRGFEVQFLSGEQALVSSADVTKLLRFIFQHTSTEDMPRLAMALQNGWEDQHSGTSTEEEVGATTPPKKSWWRFQSFREIGFRVSSISLLMVLIVVPLQHQLQFGELPWTRTSHAAIAGQLLGAFAVYFSIPLFISYVVWRVRHHSHRAATIAFCISITLLLALIQFGHSVASISATTHISTQEPDQIPIDSYAAVATTQQLFSQHHPDYDDLDDATLTTKLASTHPTNLTITEAGLALSSSESNARAALYRINVVAKAAWNGRDQYPTFDQLATLQQHPEFPINPFTKSRRIARIGFATQQDGWAYDERTGQFRLVLRSGDRCRDLSSDEFELVH